MAISKRRAIEDVKSYNPDDPQFTNKELIKRCNIVLRRFPDYNFTINSNNICIAVLTSLRAFVYPIQDWLG